MSHEFRCDLDLDRVSAPVSTTSDPDPGTATATLDAPARVSRMPQWRVLLHNDDASDMVYVVSSIRQITSLDYKTATERMLEAHTRGLSLLLTTHREHAELLVEQFASKRLIVTIEPDA